MTNLKANHGEVIPRTVTCIPQDAKKVEIKDQYIIIGLSETTGNHHRVKMADGIEFYEKDGTLYMRNTVPAEVSCVIQERHDTEIIPPGIWDINHKRREYDFLTQEERYSAD